MAFLESPRMPEKISFGAVGGPGFRTSVVTVSSGFEKRNAEWSKVRHSYDVSQAVKTQSDFEEVRNHFLAVGGKRDGFRFKDFADFTVSTGEGVVLGLTSTTFQLQKKYTFGSVNTLRDIKKPIASGFVLLNSGTPLTLTTDYTLDATTGIFTTTTPKTAANLTWTGEFDVPVRFDVDELKGQIINRKPNGEYLLAWDSIILVEVRE
jgi:uncharacterized protein (TIGR02217 family)